MSSRRRSHRRRYLEVHQTVLSLLAARHRRRDLRVVAALLHIIRNVERMAISA